MHMTATSNRTYKDSRLKGVFKQNGHLLSTRSENESEIVVLVNAEGMVTYVSPSITHFLAYTPEEIIGDHIHVLAHPDDFNALQYVSGKNGSVNNRPHEYRLRCKDGSWRWFEGSITNLLQVPGIEAIVGTFHAISQ